MEYVNTIITSPDANVFFGNDKPFLGSLLLEATLRFIALKNHRGDIEELKPIRVETSLANEYKGGNWYANHSKERGIELLILTAPGAAQLPTIDEDGWTSLDTPPYPVAPFVSSASETHIYANASIKSTVIFVRQAKPKWIDLLSSSMFRVLPWRFEDMSSDDTAFFRAISKKDTESFVKIINDSCSNYDFKRSKYKRALIGWNDGYRKQQIRRLQRNIEELHNSINEHQGKITQALCNIEKSSTDLLALQSQEDLKDDSVFRFFMNHKNITIVNATHGTISGNIMEYAITETIEYYDSDAFLRIYNNKGSSIGRADESVRKILFAIFAENKGVFRVESMFKLINLSALDVIGHMRSGLFEQTHLANPHLLHYGCLGGNSQYISDFLQKGDWDMAIEQSIAATKNINFGDAGVISDFVRDVENAYKNHCRCIIADNGKEMTPKEFLSYIGETETNEVTKNG